LNTPWKEVEINSKQGAVFPQQNNIPTPEKLKGGDEGFVADDAA
jgi:hypothetical protein